MRPAAEPQVSVVIPTRNRAALMERAVVSVLAQTAPPLEVLVVDDGSTDTTAAQTAELTRRDGRVRAIRKETAGGAPAARNAGIHAARGALVAFLDDDAVWMPSKLAEQLRALDGDPSAGVCYCAFEDVHADGGTTRVGSPGPAEGPAWEWLLHRTCIDTSTLLVKRSALQAIGGFDERLPRLQDWDLALRLARVTRFAYVPRVLARSYETSGSISSHVDRLAEACRIMAEKVDALEPRPELRAAFRRSLAHALLIGGAPAEGRRFLLRALRTHPRSAVTLGMLALSAAGPRGYGWVNRLRLRLSPGNE